MEEHNEMVICHVLVACQVWEDQLGKGGDDNIRNGGRSGNVVEVVRRRTLVVVEE